MLEPITTSRFIAFSTQETFSSNSVPRQSDWCHSADGRWAHFLGVRNEAFALGLRVEARVSGDNGPMTTLSNDIWVEKTAANASSFGPIIALPSPTDALRKSPEPSSSVAIEGARRPS